MTFGDDIPLIGRDEELAATRSALERGGCLIAGVAGVGKSRLAAEAASRSGAPVERVLATASARALPFGAFSHLLATSTGRPEIPAFIRILRERHPDAQPVLFVDDAHQLDEASAALVLALSTTDTVRLLLTVRSFEPAPDAVLSLWKDGRIDRVDVQPLSWDEVRSFVDVLLGSPSHTSVYAKVYELTEGNPLYVREMLRDSTISGALAVEEGRWSWTGSRPVMTRLRDLIESRTRGLSPAARRALGLLALAAPLDADILERLTSPNAIEELERATLARAEGAEIELVHPLYGEAIAESMPGYVARTLRGELAAALTKRGALAPHQTLRVATWTLESGRIDHDLFLAASAEALRASSSVSQTGWGPNEAALAIRLADAAGSGLLAALGGAFGRLAANRSSEVEDLLSPHEGEASRSSLETSIAYVRSRAFALHWSGTGTQRSLGLLDRAGSWHPERTWHAFLAMARAWMLLTSSPDGSRRAVEPFLDATDVDPTIRIDVLVIATLAMGRLGLIDRCEALEPEIARLAPVVRGLGGEPGWAEYAVDGLVRPEAARDLDGAAARLREGRERARVRGDEALAGSLLMAEGRVALVRGHVADAIAHLEDAVDGMAHGATRNGRGLALTYLSRCYSLRGEAEEAAKCVRLAADQLTQERPNDRRLSIEIRRAAAWVEVAGGRVAAARDGLLEVADLAGQDGDVAGQSEALYSAVRLGARPDRCAETLTALSDNSQNELIDTAAEHARVLAARDPVAQLEVARRFADLGADLFAAEAAAVASNALRKNGRADLARRAASLSVLHEQRCQGALTPALKLRGEVITLTPREREVVSLVVRGMSNAEIADRLVISVRTVESNVLRACRKLGVSNRIELGEVLQSSQP